MSIFAFMAVSAVALAGDISKDVSPVSAAHWFFGGGYGQLLPGSTEEISLWRAESTRKVPRRHSPPEKKCRGLALRTAVNEAEAVQLVVFARKPLADIRVKLGVWPASKSGEEIPSVAFDILRVGYVPVMQPSDSSGCAALWPDPLPPQGEDFRLAVPASANQPFWIRVKPPKGTPKGVYRGVLHVDCLDMTGEGKTLKVPLAVEVFGFSMPDVYTFKTIVGHGMDMFRYHKARNGETRAAVADGYFAMLGDNHVSPCYPAGFRPVTCRFPGFRKGDDPLNAQAVFNWKDFDSLVEHALSRYHSNAFCISVAGARGIGGRLSEMFAWLVADEPGRGILMDRYFKGIEAHLSEKGWLGKAHVLCGNDAEAISLLKKHAPGLRRVADVPFADGVIDRNGSDMRTWYWRAWEKKSEGVRFLQAMHWNSVNVYPDSRRPQNPYVDAMSWSRDKGTGLGNGAGRLVYPPESCFGRSSSGEFTGELQTDGPVFDAPVGCIRLDMIRDGIEDYEYFVRLKSLDPGNELLKVPSEVYVTSVRKPDESNPLELHRFRMAREIERLEKERSR